MDRIAAHLNAAIRVAAMQKETFGGLINRLLHHGARKADTALHVQRGAFAEKQGFKPFRNLAHA